MIYKCENCKIEMVHPSNDKYHIQCPNHCGTISFDGCGVIIGYVFHHRTSNTTKYTIDQYGTHDCNTMEHKCWHKPYIVLQKKTKTPKTQPNRKGKLIFTGYDKSQRTLLNMDGFFPLKISADGTVLVSKLFNKLQICVVFS